MCRPRAVPVRSLPEADVVPDARAPDTASLPPRACAAPARPARSSRGCAASVFGLLLALAPLVASAAPPQVLVFGGGWGPEGTQASIEAHVEALARGLPGPKGVLFAAGGRNRSVQIPAAEPDEASAILGLVFDRRENLGVDYRPTRLEPTGRASRQAVLRALAAARRAGPALVFGAGHGAPPTEELPAALELWGPDDRLDVYELARALDRGPGHTTAFVLGQCHSGAFADVMFTGADPEIGLAEPTRCVFAAVPADREAAGCTPDVDDPGARAYLAVFAEALADRDAADLDGDGRLTLAEADAFARVRDATVDVPVKTSDVWLNLRLGARASKVEAMSREALLAAADPTERAVLQAVLPRPDRDLEPRSVVKAHARLDASIRALDEHVRDLVDRREGLRRRLVDAVLLRWPELANPYHVKARALLAGDAVELVRFVKGRPELDGLLAIDKSVRALDDRLLTLQRKAARFERWLRAAQRVADERALRATKDPARIAALDALEACEAMVIP